MSLKLCQISKILKRLGLLKKKKKKKEIGIREQRREMQLIKCILIINNNK